MRCVCFHVSECRTAFIFLGVMTRVCIAHFCLHARAPPSRILASVLRARSKSQSEPQESRNSDNDEPEVLIGQRAKMGGGKGEGRGGGGGREGWHSSWRCSHGDVCLF